jgi:hypothetical protein
MYKIVAVLYFVCFGLYILFSRQPDYFDGELSPATIHFVKDSTGATVPVAAFTVGKDAYQVPARYVFRQWKNGQRMQVIFDTSYPQQAVVYSWWGYWITWGEAVASVVLLLVLFQVAVQVTSNPTAEALAEEQEMRMPQPKKRKYKD